MNRLKELREANKWTQGQLGKKIDAARNTVSGYETEERQMTSELICRLCDIFGCTSDYLLGRSITRWPAISDDDAALLDAFKASPENMQDGIRTMLAPYMVATEKKVIDWDFKKNRPKKKRCPKRTP